MKESFFHGISREGFHRVYYREYGAPQKDKTFVCVHGLTRNSCDFHYLAEALQDEYHVVAPDVVGRGQSDRLQKAESYGYEQYLSDINAMLQRLDVPQVDWLGTSMGGLFGILMAAMPKTPIRRLILNDIGPFVPAEAIQRITLYASVDVVFETFEQANAVLKETYAPFGPMNDEQWGYLLSHSLVKNEDGYRLAYDPKATGAVQGNELDKEQNVSFKDAMGNVTFWDFWDKITCPVLVINGRHSDILPQQVVEEMRTRGPKFDHVFIEDAGHAPSLMPTDQIDVVKNWLQQN